MRAITVLLMLVPATIFAQARPPFSAVRGGSQSVGALGGSYAGQGSSRPLGGVAPPFDASRARQPQQQPGKPRYYGPVYYIPNAFGQTFTEPEPAPAPVGYAPGVQFSNSMPAVQPPQTVIVNQYYSKDQAPLNSGISTTPLPVVESKQTDYYLIAYKNRHVITALAYWVDGETLHYMTAANVHNQSTLNLIDLEMTKRLNADREVPFSVASSSVLGK